MGARGAIEDNSCSWDAFDRDGHDVQRKRTIGKGKGQSKGQRTLTVDHKVLIRELEAKKDDKESGWKSPISDVI
jgi:hypothetical protein